MECGGGDASRNFTREAANTGLWEPRIGPWEPSLGRCIGPIDSLSSISIMDAIRCIELHSFCSGFYHVNVWTLYSSREGSGTLSKTYIARNHRQSSHRDRRQTIQSAIDRLKRGRVQHVWGQNRCQSELRQLAHTPRLGPTGI